MSERKFIPTWRSFNTFSQPTRAINICWPLHKCKNLITPGSAHGALMCHIIGYIRRQSCRHIAKGLSIHPVPGTTRWYTLGSSRASRTSRCNCPGNSPALALGASIYTRNPNDGFISETPRQRQGFWIKIGGHWFG